jgi:hypothetical protein
VLPRGYHCERTCLAIDAETYRLTGPSIRSCRDPLGHADVRAPPGASTSGFVEFRLKDPDASRVPVIMSAMMSERLAPLARRQIPLWAGAVAAFAALLAGLLLDKPRQQRKPAGSAQRRCAERRHRAGTGVLVAAG